jgi:hydrogenase maturation protease
VESGHNNPTAGASAPIRWEGTPGAKADFAWDREERPAFQEDFPRVLIAGVGNELLSDDGVGVHAVRALQAEPIPGVTMIEIGTAILHGLDYLESADRVLVIDAANGGQPPGTIYLFDAEANERPKAVTSIHAMGLREAANLLLDGQRVPSITVLGVEPQTFDYGMKLSCPVQAALPRVVSLARQTVLGWRREKGPTTTAVLAEA